MNPAKRILSILDPLLGLSLPGNTHAAVAWARAFKIGLSETNGYDEDEVAAALQAFRAEVSLASSLLELQEIPKVLYHNQFESIKQLASTVRMHTDWNSVRGMIQPPEVRLAVGWAATVLPDTEDEVAEEDISQLHRACDDLAVALDQASVPPPIRAYAIKQLRALRSALRLYRVQGIRAVRDALEQAAGAAIVARPLLEAEASDASDQTRGVMQKVNAGLSRAVSMCDSVDKVNKGASAMLNMAEGLKMAWELGKQFLPG